MAIIEIAPGQTQGTKGIEKTIDKASEKMVYNVLQNTMYSYPIESTVRENFSNLVDSIREKNIAKEILTGKSKVEDYFIERVGAEYQDSKFNKAYYDLDYLDDRDITRITYTENDGIGFCDTIEFYDTGVGLSPERFIKAVGLAYSTKRNTMKTIGGWGLGLKSSLSTDVDYFTIESCWNGKKIIANCYKYKTDFVIPKFNGIGEVNPSIEVPVGENTYIIYYESSPDKNYTKVITPSKKINRSKYQDAVEHQLMYFPTLEFVLVEEDGEQEIKDLKATVLYNSKNIIISDSRYYSKPHIVIVKSEDESEGVNYGYIDFRELELEQLYGSVGMKCLIKSEVQNEDGSTTILQEGVSVTPSREKVIFNESTKTYLLNKFKAVVNEASNIVQEQLKETDFLVWLQKANQILVRTDNSSVLGRMSCIIDKKEITPLFGDSGIRFKQSPSILFAANGINVRINSKRYDWRTKKDTIERTSITDWSHINWEHIYLQTDQTSVVKDMYITTVLSSDTHSFISIKEGDLDIFIESLSSKMPENVNAEIWADLQKKEEAQRLSERDEILKHLKQSRLLKSYDDIEIPEDWKNKLEELEKKIDASGNLVSLTPQEKRKLEQKIVVQTLRKNDDIDRWVNNNQTYYSFDKQEPKGIDFQNEENVYYGTDDDKELLHIASCCLDRQFKMKTRMSLGDNNYYLNEFKLVKVAEVIARKYCKTHNKIQKLFYNLTEDGVMKSSTYIKEWYTAKKVYNTLANYEFLYNYNTINPEIHTLFLELEAYRDKYFIIDSNWTNKDMYRTRMEELNTYLGKIENLQLYVIDHKENPENIANKANELFGSDIIKDGNVLNMDIYNKLQTLSEYAEPLRALFNQVECLIQANEIPNDTERQIRLYLEMKGLDNFKIPEWQTINQSLDSIIIAEELQLETL